MGNSALKGQNRKLADQEIKRLHLPLSRDAALSLRAGDVVLISGDLITGRDKLHRYLSNEKPSRSEIPFDLRGTILYHCGPIVRKTRNGYRCIAAGPTTSMRVEQYVPGVIAGYGIRGLMGKGGMGEQTLRALGENGCVYLSAVGGAAVYLAGRVNKVAGVWKLQEFGMAEAMWILEVNEFPAIVTMDSHGRSLHDEIEAKSRTVFDTLLRSRYG